MTPAPAGRSFSSDPRTLRPLSARRLAVLEERESEMADKLGRALSANAHCVAIVSRVGSDLSKLQFENESPRYTHVGFALRDATGWRVHQVLNTAEGPEGHLYRQSLVEFFRDDPFEYRVSLLVPSLGLQSRIAAVLESTAVERLHSTRYSRVAYPYSTRYQNSNQWAVEVVGAAQAGSCSRAGVQIHLAARGLRPSVLRTAGLVGQTVGALFSRNTHFDDHPLRERIRGRLAFMLESSLRDYVRRTDRLIAELELALGVPLGARCPLGRVVGAADD